MAELSEIPLAELTALAVEAGRKIIEVREHSISWDTKADGSVVTRADTEAEAIILAGLARICPGKAVVAEEAYASGRLPESLGRDFILVDPLDGTREFIDGRDEFTVNIAYIVDGRPVAGVVVAPAMGQGFVGLNGQAWSFDVGQDGPNGFKSLAARPRPARLVAVVSRSHAAPETLKFLEHFDIAHRHSYGSSLKLCRLATGEADIYPRHGPTMEWDIAAGDAVLRGAGGIAVALDGRPLTYGKQVSSHGLPFSNPHFVAFGNWQSDEIQAALNPSRDD